MIKKYTKAKKAKNTECSKNIVHDMKENTPNPKLHWSLLDKLKTSGKNDRFIRLISPKKWEAHFKNLLLKEDANEIKIDILTDTATDSPLDSFITIKEIQKIAQKIKSRRATGIDLIGNEMLQILAECKPEILCHLFNKILFSSELP